MVSADTQPQSRPPIDEPTRPHTPDSDSHPPQPQPAPSRSESPPPHATRLPSSISRPSQSPSKIQTPAPSFPTAHPNTPQTSRPHAASTGPDRLVLAGT